MQQPVARRASLSRQGTPEVGAKLLVHFSADCGRGMRFRPRVLKAAPGEELRWLGKLVFTGIADGEHFFVLTTNRDGTTRLNHGERYSGALVALAKGDRQKSAAGYEAFSQALKQRVENLSEHQ
jgi:hypothetical protein